MTKKQKFKKNYFGYVYRWLNRSNNMKYIGSHYGSVEDSYLGSSKWFLSSYTRNPENFIMEVLEYVVVDDTKEILCCEQRWLDKIKDIKSDNEYYNLKNEAEGGWSHLTEEHIINRAKALIEKHQVFGLSESELKSYPRKIQTRLNRWATNGFSVAEKEQHNKYSVRVKVITPDNNIIFFDSLSKASKYLQFDSNYGSEMTQKRGSYKDYQIFRISEPEIDCRHFKL